MSDCCAGKRVTFRDLVSGRLALSLVQTYSRIQMLEDACTFDAICDCEPESKLRDYLVEELNRQKEELAVILTSVNLDEEVDPYLASILLALTREEAVCRNQRSDLFFDGILGLEDNDDVDDGEKECDCGCGGEEEEEEEEETDHLS